MSLASGTKLGPYKILAPWGAGGTGEVYRARDSRLGRDVAIKILPESLAFERYRLRRFEQEARSVGALNNPNILSYFTDLLQGGRTLPFVRAIGRWTMTALVINCIVGNAIFGLPSEITRLVGRASPIAMIVGALAFAIIMACLAEVASQFSEPGGVYLYVRTAFGRFVGMQARWFYLLAAGTGGAANTSLFLIYLAGVLPWAGGKKRHSQLLVLLISLVCLSLFTGCGAGTLGPGVSPPSLSLVSIAITPADADLLLGTLQQFTAIGTFSDHSTQDITASVTWSSSDINVAPIAGGGLVTAVALGSATVSASLDSVTGTTTVNVQPAVLSFITVRPVNKKIAPLTTQQFQAIGTFTDGSTHNVTGQVSWTSSNTAVATIGVRGLAKAVSPGSTTITAKLDSISGSTTLDISNATIVSVTVTPSGRTIAPGTRLNFIATGLFSDGTRQVITRDSTWASDNPAVATVGARGNANAIGPGTVNISATFDGVSGSSALNVSSATLTSISVAPASAVLAPTTSVNLVARGTYSDGSTQVINNIVTWTSSEPKVASVAGGNVTALSAGNATITAALGGLSANSAVVVDGSPLTSVEVSPHSVSIPVQTRVAFVATGRFADGNTQDLTSSVLWTSSPASVAIISNVPGTIGQATGLQPGTATITALFGGQIGTASLTVTSATLTSLRISPTSVNIEQGGSTQFTALADFSDGTTKDVTSWVTWTSSNENVAVVTPKGVAMSVRSGTTAVTATMNDLTGTAVLNIY